MARIRISKDGKLEEIKVRDLNHLRSQQTFKHQVVESKKKYKRRHKYHGKTY